jgi:hypothetical protein
MEDLKLVPAKVSMLLSRASSPIVAASSECGDEPEEATASSLLKVRAEAMSANASKVIKHAAEK